MNNDLQFDFTVDKAAKTITIIREFGKSFIGWLHERVHGYVNEPGKPVDNAIA